MHLHFSVDDVNNITKKINVTFGDTELQFPLPNAHKGCDDLLGGLTCPLYAGDEVNFVLKMPVSSLYPKVMTLKFKDFKIVKLFVSFGNVINFLKLNVTKCLNFRLV